MTTRTPQLGSAGRWLAPVMSIVGLLIVSFITLSLLNNDVPFVGRSKGNGSGNGAIIGGGSSDATPAPSNVVVVPSQVAEVKVPGTIVYAKAGNIWVQTGKDVRQLTTGGKDSMPSWAPDGKSVYFIRTTNGLGHWFSGNVLTDYQMTIPNIMQVQVDGGASPVRLMSGRVSILGHPWHAWIRQPVVSPDGHTMAFVSDRPNPSQSDVVLQFYDLGSKKSTNPQLVETAPLGHQDPAWRPDGKALLYVRNSRDGAKGAPVIYRWDVARKKATPLTGPGYLEPSYSPDGLYIAATKQSSFGNDLVILDATNGREIERLTTDGASWAPVWSPVGDSIAFLHIRGQIVDLDLIRFDGTAPDWTVKDVIALTEVSGLDGDSRPGWFVPANEIPKPSPTPVSSRTSSTASPAASR